jgi:ADP-heptose:LPS heptosyltransferase
MLGINPPVLPLDAKTLLICPIGLGNFLMTTPALGLLHRHLGTDNLGILALRGGIADLAQGSGWFGHIHRWDPDKQGLSAGLRILREIRAQRYTHSLSLFPSFHWKFGLFARAVGAKTRLGFRRPKTPSTPGTPAPGPSFPAIRSWFTEPYHHALTADPLAHDTDQNLRWVEALVGRRHPGPIRLSWPLSASAYPGRPASDYVVVHPGSSAERGMAEKRLPPSTFAAWIVKLFQEFRLVSVLVGGPEEKDLRAHVAREVASLGAPEALVEVPTRSLSDLGSLVRDARLYLGNDSGIMHVAVALGIPCAAVFGPTDPRRTGPYGYEQTVGRDKHARPRHLILGRSDLTCRPCRTGANIGTHPECVTHDIRCIRDFKAEDGWRQLQPFVQSLLQG